ncbi:helix-turn-helix transcriptional regulator [Microbacterium testaceum]|uniref:helix-turn-helix transcriptional regulator n=1 Tax=Microbacterium testaceum TaxID=2033 RepID=UPI003448DEFB
MGRSLAQRIRASRANRCRTPSRPRGGSPTCARVLMTDPRSFPPQPLAREEYRHAVRSLGALLLQTRLSRGLSQEDVAHRAHISVHTYASLERLRSRSGSLPNPTLETLLRVFRALDLTLDLSSGRSGEHRSR